MTKNRIEIQGDVALIHLTRGKIAVVDAADLPLLTAHTWTTVIDHKGNVYAKTGFKQNGTMIYPTMHRMIMGAAKGQQVDHINGNGLDNRRSNLRIATNAENQMNARKRRGCASIFKGVCLSASGRFRAYIKDGRKYIHIGCFTNEVEAARAYDEAARRLFGSFARCNFPLTEAA